MEEKNLLKSLQRSGGQASFQTHAIVCLETNRCLGKRIFSL